MQTMIKSIMAKLPFLTISSSATSQISNDFLVEESERKLFGYVIRLSNLTR